VKTLCRSFHEAVQGFKKELVRSALRMHSGNKLKAAIELGISRCYLHRLLNQFNLAEANAAAGVAEGLDDEDSGAESEFSGFRATPAKSERVAMRIA
jgi:Transcriptional regulator containing PAS, AAA-type ATPase, and DNA-binding domains